MVEEITTALSRFKRLFVIARNSSFTFKGKAVDVKEVGHRLGVRYILEGSVRKASGKIRVTGQLVDAVTGAQSSRCRWFLFAIVVAALAVNVSAEAERINQHI